MRKKLLLADDSITIRKVVEMIFSHRDYDLLSAADGDKAYALALTEKPDLLIADVVMPGRNGFELCREVKSNPALAATAVLLLPGAFEEFDEQKAAEVGADGWLVKPFESQSLLDKVEALLSVAPARLTVADESAQDILVPEDELGIVIADDEDELLEAPEVPVDEDELFEAPEVPVDEELSISDEEQVWGSISFEEENLKPHDVLAATDEDDQEPEILEDDDSGFLLVTDDQDEEKEEPAELFADAKEDIVEVMEDTTLDEDMVEDEKSFIGHAEDRQDVFSAEDEILELTESEIIEPVEESPLISGGDTGIGEEIIEPVAFEPVDVQPEALADADTSLEPMMDEEPFFETEKAASIELQEDPDFVFSTADDDTSQAEKTVAEPLDDEQDFTFVAENQVAEVSSEPSVAEPDLSFSEVSVEEETPLVTTAEQVEAQLKSLSEEELLQIVERVAGPLIEKLAQQTLERIVWEVVPDLAESMIRAEIDQIKQADEN